MFLGLLTLFTGPFSKIATWGTIIVVSASLLFGGVKYLEHEATQKALIKWNQDQLTIVQKEKEQALTDLNTLQKHQHELELEIMAEDSKLKEREKFIETFIVSHPSTNFDPLFDEVLKKMRGE